MTHSVHEHDPKTCPQIFEGVSEENMETILKSALVRTFPPDHILVHQGDVPTHTYVLLEGHLRTFRVDEDGHEATIRMLARGETCMDAALFIEGPSPIAVQATTSVTLLMIPEKTIRLAVANDLVFAGNIIKILSKHYKNAMLQIDSINIKAPLRRVGYYFLIKHLEEGYDKATFELPFKKLTIANYLGMTPETFSRSLKQMKQLGINVDGEKITLNDVFTLCQFCDYDSAALCNEENKRKCPHCLHAEIPTTKKDIPCQSAQNG